MSILFQDVLVIYGRFLELVQQIQTWLVIDGMKISRPKIRNATAFLALATVNDAGPIQAESLLSIPGVWKGGLKGRSIVLA